MIITFVGPIQSRFVKNDIAILKRKHELRIIDVSLGRGGSAAMKLIKLELKILRSVFGSDILFFWFADYYSLLPTLLARLLGKRVYVVAGGYDVTYTPEVKSGARVRPLRWFLVRNTHRFATRNFPVSNYANHLLDTNSVKHGPSTMIYNAVEYDRFPLSDGPRQLRALTVTQTDMVLEYIRKGIDVFLNVARIMPDVGFDLIGIRGAALEYARSEANELQNVAIIEGPMDDNLIMKYYQTDSAYCQLSMDETFGLATAEAMSCGAIPVVSDVPSHREVTGGTEHIVDRKNISEIAEAIRKSFSATSAERKQCSDYVRKFDIEDRAKRLLELVK
ncbi:MAG: glycosyltransferase [Ignavibacteriota bacterium]